tara:strand:- start:740 stop:1237 length:498 start_codon:yes stop_codon:yes gene_type:complete
MKYEDRKRVISSWLFNLLKRYEAPSHLDEAAAREEMVLMVEDINSEVPNISENGLKDHLERVARFVRKNQTSRRWPTISIFVKGVRENSKNFDASDAIRSEGASWNDPMLINAKRIKRGEAVDDTYLLGSRRDELVRLGYINLSDIEPYEKTLAWIEKKSNVSDI